MSAKQSQEIEKLAHHIDKAYQSREGVEPLTMLVPSLSNQEAYQVQLHTVNKWVSQGRKITGKKIGLTSKAMQELLGVGEPDYGHLLDSMAIDLGGEISSKSVLQPKVEAEMAFVLNHDLKGPNVTSFDVLMATDYVVPALEIVDSRIKDWEIKLPDTISDNASSGLYVLGDKPTKITDIDLKQIGMALYKNGKVANTGVGAAALGDPAFCVAWLANKLSEYDISLKAGEIILSGALSAAVVAEAGDHFQARFANLGEVSVRFTE